MSAQKDIIYIDVEDDIAKIVDKIKKSSSSIVAIVPPKRIGVLQSIVNLRLISRAASTSKKRVVIVTGNQSLSVLAGSANIPVAKTLQTKPEIIKAKKATTKKSEAIITGTVMAEEPVTESAPKKTPEVDEEEAAVATIEAEEEDQQTEEKVPAVTKKRMRIPDFSIFRKRLLFFGLFSIFLGAGLIWAIFFAPHAKITVTARTQSVPISQRLNVAIDAKLSAKDMTLPALKHASTQEVSAPITPTGEKDVGEKATGTVRLSRASSSTTTIPANTIVRSASGLAYVTTEAATIPATSIEQFFSTGVSSVDVKIVASESGEQYNAATGKGKISVSGVSANFVSATEGGSTKVVKVITEKDIENAKREVEKKKDEAKAMQSLKQKISENARALDRTFIAKEKSSAPSIAVGKEVPAGSQATLETVYSYSMMGVNEADLSTYLTKVVTKTLDGSTDRKIFDNGIKQVSITNVDITDNGAGFTLTTNAKVGPSIGEEKIRELVRGKEFSVARSSIEAINGVSSVDIAFSYFWVNSVPNDDEQITVEYNVDGE